jgi:glycosyltransferase involved in cell wall biosynthesis
VRIVIDMQGLQTESRFRGIGRYTLSLTQAIVCNRGGHEVILALNGLFPETIEPIRAAFNNILPQTAIRVWNAIGPVKEGEESNAARRQAAELLRESFIQSLQPDVVHIPSLFEGYHEDAVLSIGRLDRQSLVSVTLHDLIPLMNPAQYLDHDSRFAAYYRNKLDHLARADLLLTISDSSSQEALERLKVPASKLVNTSEAADAMFRVLEISPTERRSLLRPWHITRPFVLYSGGGDERKNLPRLIEAYARLPITLRQRHQLVFAGRIPQGIVAELQAHGRISGLGESELVFTGYITDEELVKIYNLCHLFVFPSWHEGFGLPALEAMACGAPVTGADISSLREVIGYSPALFDPHNVQSIESKVREALESSPFRLRLKVHGKLQAKRLSWDRSARLALAAWDQLVAEKRHHAKSPVATSPNQVIRHLAGRIADWSNRAKYELSAAIALNQQAGFVRQLFLDVSELCQHDAATGVQRVVRSYLKELLDQPPIGFVCEPVYATREHGYRYARRFTSHFTGRRTHQGQKDTPIHWQRGDVFFGLDMQHHVQLAQRVPLQMMRTHGVTVKFLVHDLLPIQLDGFFSDPEAKKLHEEWLGMLAGFDGAICVSKATADAYSAWINHADLSCSPGFQVDWVHNGADINGSRPSSGLPTGANAVLTTLRARPSFLAVSTLEPRKQQQQILDAVESLWQQGLDINLVLVGKEGWHVEALGNRLRSHPERDRRLFWLAGISDQFLEQVYRSCSALIAASLNEGFGLSLVEAGYYGLAIIARDIPVFREVAGEHASYFSAKTPEQLASHLAEWLNQYRAGRYLKPDGIRWNTWTQSAAQLKHALVEKHYPRRQLLVDISELVQRDARSGIQRVVRSILKEWLSNPPEGYRVEPVSALPDEGYRYARSYTQSFMGWPAPEAEDSLIDHAPGDIFFGLDMQPQVQIAHAPFYQVLRRNGVTVKFLIHDLLPIQMPEFFPAGNEEGFTQWLKVIAECDGAVCVSETTAKDLEKWLLRNTNWERKRPFHVAWSHNGADVASSMPSKGRPADADLVVEQLNKHPSFLMVGTLEPRKGHLQVLDAFDKLWLSGQQINLVIVGKIGWKSDALIDRLTGHPDYGVRLLWLDGISDEYLEEIYASCSCLIAASYGEGFGLPLIEAAQHNIPVIARDIPVFREVAGECAKYFGNKKPDSLQMTISKWLSEQKTQKRTTEPLNWITWQQSAKNLSNILVNS